MRTGATLSACRRYRYALWREWDDRRPTVVFCGLNPSTADETKDDATIRRELGFATAWGFGRLMKVNLYAWRSTDPEAMLLEADPIGPDNLATVLHWATRSELFVACWGNHAREREAFPLRVRLRNAGVRIHALRVTKQGNPEHTLRLPRKLWPMTWPGGQPWAPSWKPMEER